MIGKKTVTWLLFWWFPSCFAVSGADASKQAVRTVSSGDALHWGVGLLIVLAIFFLCVWGMRKLSGISVNGAEKMRVVGGLSLGMREKVILLQVGKKQLILGVTPGRIEALHVLEGDDCLNSEPSPSMARDSGFAQKLMQVMKGRSDD
ncbi:flagellar biosynthetic protein FliO [Methylobacter svalbardensis]|uniref:flagellar biosynthetic protein FliO n=1 Tax=Methylobacter svalbardensis TaxID=3080016 RepID=UPI0030EE0A24